MSLQHKRGNAHSQPLLASHNVALNASVDIGRTETGSTSAPLVSQQTAFQQLLSGAQHLFTNDFRIEDMSSIRTMSPPSCSAKLCQNIIAVPLILSNPIGWVYGCTRVRLVPQGSIGLVMNAGKPEVLGVGWHTIFEPLRSWRGCVPLSQEVIQFGTLTLVTIKDGWIGLAWDRGVPILLPPGMHQWDSATMKWDRAFDCSTNFQAGPYSFVTVKKGDIGVSFDRGELKMLDCGFHVLGHALHTFSHNISIRQQFDKLTSSKLLSQDTVEMDLDSTVAWQVVNPEMAALNARDMSHLRELVHRQARAALSECVFRMSVSNAQPVGTAVGGLSQSADSVLGGGVASASTSTAVPADLAQTADGSTVQAQSVAALSDLTSSPEMLKQCNCELETIGVKIFKIAIVKLDITDVEVLRALARGATIAVTIREKRKVAEVEAESAVLQARAQAEGKRLGAQAEAYAEKQRADAQEYYAQKVAASAQALEGTPLAGQLMQLHASSEVFSSTSSSMVIVGGGGQNGDIPSALLGNSSITKMAGSSQR